jgi:hypothetical protein
MAAQSDTGSHLDLVNQVLAESLRLQQEAIEAAKAEERASIQKIEELVRLQELKEQANALEEKRILQEANTQREYERFIEAEHNTHETINRLVVSVEKMLSNTSALIGLFDAGGGMSGDIRKQGGEIHALLSIVSLVSNNVLLILEILRVQLAHMDGIMHGFNIKMSQRDEQLRERLLQAINGAVVARTDINFSNIGAVDAAAGTVNIVDGAQR